MRTRLTLALALAVLVLLGAAAVPAPTCHGPKYADGTWDAATSTCDNVTFVCEQGEDVIIRRVTVSGTTCTVKYFCCEDYQP